MGTLAWGRITTWSEEIARILMQLGFACAGERGSVLVTCVTFHRLVPSNQKSPTKRDPYVELLITLLLSPRIGFRPFSRKRFWSHGIPQLLYKHNQIRNVNINLNARLPWYGSNTKQPQAREGELVSDLYDLDSTTNATYYTRREGRRGGTGQTRNSCVRGGKYESM